MIRRQRLALYLPGPIRLTAGRAIRLLLFAADGNGLLVFPAVPTAIGLVGADWCDRAAMAAVWVVPGDGAPGRRTFQCALGRLRGFAAVGGIHAIADGPADQPPCQDTTDNARRAAVKCSRNQATGSGASQSPDDCLPMLLGPTASLGACTACNHKRYENCYR
jgi:hypothetical protein